MKVRFLSLLAFSISAFSTLGLIATLGTWNVQWAGSGKYQMMG